MCVCIYQSERSIECINQSRRRTEIDEELFRQVEARDWTMEVDIKDYLCFAGKLLQCKVQPRRVESGVSREKQLMRRRGMKRDTIMNVKYSFLSADSLERD